MMPPTKAPDGRSDRLVRIQLFAAFVVPLLLLGFWLGSRGFFEAP